MKSDQTLVREALQLLGKLQQPILWLPFVAKSVCSDDRIERIEAVEITPLDTIVFTLDECPDDDHIQELLGQLQELFPDNDIIVTALAHTITTIRKEG